jgi:hypothetical protein
MASATVRLAAVTVSILIIVASFIGINLFQDSKKTLFLRESVWHIYCL